MFTSRDSVGIQGLGQAACPSQEQAAGIVDCYDPCQVSSAACAATAPAATAAAATAAGNIVLTPAQFANINTENYTQGQLNPVSTTTCPAGATCSIISGVSNTTIYLAGGILGALILIMSMSGGGRRR